MAFPAATSRIPDMTFLLNPAIRLCGDCYLSWRQSVGRADARLRKETEMSRANRIRIAAVTAAAAIMATAVPAAASAAEEEWNATWYYLLYRSSACIESLTVHVAEDSSAPGDEPYLRVNGWQIWESPERWTTGPPPR
ncbi:hypothetical protein GCM10029992_19440 [Glycomyces albus]